MLRNDVFRVHISTGGSTPASDTSLVQLASEHNSREIYSLPGIASVIRGAERSALSNSSFVMSFGRVTFGVEFPVAVMLSEKPDQSKSDLNLLIAPGYPLFFQCLPRHQVHSAALIVSHVAISTGKTGIPLFSPEFYAACSVGGALSCGLTHTLVTPLDLVKCRRQVDPKLYTSIVNGWSTIYRTVGARGLVEGWGPTLIGYSMQGACKFGFYEYFKKTFADIAGPELANKYRTTLYLTASASAEVIADVALCPMEALKIRMQTSVAAPFATSATAGFSRIIREEGVAGLYKGLVPLWMRQVPYTMMKFAAFEKTVEAIYKYGLSKPKHEYNKLEQLGVTFAAGYWAGIFCAVVSHPADTVVSKLNNISRAPGEGTGAVIGRILSDLGFKGVWRGLGARIVMIGTLTALQWFIYDTFKVYVGLPTSGAVEKR